MNKLLGLFGIYFEFHFDITVGNYRISECGFFKKNYMLCSTGIPVPEWVRI